MYKNEIYLVFILLNLTSSYLLFIYFHCILSLEKLSRFLGLSFGFCNFQLHFIVSSIYIFLSCLEFGEVKVIYYALFRNSRQSLEHYHRFGNWFDSKTSTIHSFVTKFYQIPSYHKLYDGWKHVSSLHKFFEYSNLWLPTWNNFSWNISYSSRPVHDLERSVWQFTAIFQSCTLYNRFTACTILLQSEDVLANNFNTLFIYYNLNSSNPK